MSLQERPRPLDTPPFGMPSGLYDLWVAADIASRSLSPELQGAALLTRADIRTFTAISLLEGLVQDAIRLLDGAELSVVARAKVHSIRNRYKTYKEQSV